MTGFYMKCSTRLKWINIFLNAVPELNWVILYEFFNALIL